MRRWVLVALLLGMAAPAAHGFNQELRVGQEPFVGHGELVRRAAVGTPFEPRIGPLIMAQRELDFPGASPEGLGLGDLWQALMSGYAPEEQKKHFLRWYSGLPEWRAVTRSLERDWAEAVGYVRGEVLAAYRGPVAAEAGPLGHALHALQDSYSTAHVLRTPAGRIRSMAYYPARDGHGLTDDRDRIWTEAGELKPEARMAVTASHELLAGYARWRTADEAAFTGWLEDYLQRHLALDTP